MTAVKTMALYCDARDCRAILHTTEISESIARTVAAQEHEWTVIIVRNNVKGDLCPEHSTPLKQEVWNQ